MCRRVVFNQAKLRASSNIQHVDQDRMIVVDRLNRQGPSRRSNTLLTVLAHILGSDCAKWFIVKEIDEVPNVIPSHAIAFQFFDLFEFEVLVCPLSKGHRLSLLLHGTADLAS
jgi:uncharacterized protein YbaR (Trm112 family)